MSRGKSPSNRMKARLAGEKYFFSEKPCLNGHTTKRLASSSNCIDCQNAWRRKHAAANPEKARFQSNAWRMRNPERARQLQKAWNAAHPEKQKARARKWFLANKERANEQQRQYALRYPERKAARVKDWQSRNRGRMTAAVLRRHAAELTRTPPWVDHEAITAIYVLARNRREAGERVEVDHVIPLRGRAVSGLHIAENLQIIHSQQNKRKSNHFFEE